MPACDRRLRFMLALILPLAPTTGQNADTDGVDPKIAAFAEKITDVTWWNRGTYQVKGVRFDGEALVPVREDGRALNPYDTYFLEDGLIRVVYNNGTSTWFFFDEDLKYHASVKVAAERVFALAEGSEAKPVERFPQDLVGLVFESSDDSPENRPAKVRWNGKELKFAALHGDEWKTERHIPFVANRRAFETRASADIAIWFVFSADGTEAYLLQVENVFGARREDVPAQSKRTVAESGLSEQLNELANHMFDLMDAGKKEPVWTLQRQFERKLAAKPELLERLRKQVNSR